MGDFYDIPYPSSVNQIRCSPLPASLVSCLKWNWMAGLPATRRSNCFYTSALHVLFCLLSMCVAPRYHLYTFSFFPIHRCHSNLSMPFLDFAQEWHPFYSLKSKRHKQISLLLWMFRSQLEALLWKRLGLITDFPNTAPHANLPQWCISSLYSETEWLTVWLHWMCYRRWTSLLHFLSFQC